MTLHILAGSADAAGLISGNELLPLPAEKDGEYLIVSADAAGSIVLLEKRSVFPFILAAAVIGVLALGIARFQRWRRKNHTEEDTK